MPGELTSEGKEKVRKKLLREGLKLKSFWQREVPVYRGQYKNSISVEMQDWNKAVVGTNLDYARKLEYGLGQGQFPDFNDLKKWVDRKIGPEPGQLDAVTYLIGSKIEEEGVDQNASLQRALRKFKTQKG